MDAAHRGSCRQQVSRAAHPSVVTPKPPRVPETSSLPAVHSRPEGGRDARLAQDEKPEHSKRSAVQPAPDARGRRPVHPAASLHSRPGAAGGSVGSATRARARRVGRGAPGNLSATARHDVLGGGGAPRLTRGAGSPAQLSPLVAACPAPRLSQPTTSMRAPDRPDRHGRSPCSPTKCPVNAVCCIVLGEPVGSGRRKDRRPPPRVLPRHRRRGAHTDPARRATRTRRRARHRPSPPRGGCPVGRCGRREHGGGRRLLAVDPEGTSMGGG